MHSILERRFADSRLPPEAELAKMLGVSRTTVRSALQSLEQHGVLTRTPRRGTQVHRQMSPSMVALQRLISFARLLEEQGYVVSLKTEVATVVGPPPEAIKALGLDGSTSCYEIQRVLVASGKPAIWAIDYFPVGQFARKPRKERVGASPFEMGDLLVGGPIDHAVVELVPRKATPAVVQRLRLKPSEPYLQLREIHYSGSGKPIGFSLIHVNDHFVRFQMHRDGDVR